MHKMSAQKRRNSGGVRGRARRAFRVYARAGQGGHDALDHESSGRHGGLRGGTRGVVAARGALRAAAAPVAQDRMPPIPADKLTAAQQAAIKEFKAARS